MIPTIPTSPNTLAIKLLVAIVMLTLTAFFSYRFGLDIGETKEKEQWTAREKKFSDAELLLRKEHSKEMAELTRTHQQTNRKNTHDHETILEKVHTDLAAARAESRRLGGLRIPVSTPSCRDARALAEASSTGQRDEEVATTVALPERIEADLWTVVGLADEIVEQARACQAWIVDNGFYGKDPAKAD